MLMISRRIFADGSVSASLNFTTEALCKYNMQVEQIDMTEVRFFSLSRDFFYRYHVILSNQDSGRSSINAWFRAQSDRALDTVSNVSAGDPAREVRTDIVPQEGKSGRGRNSTRR